MNNLKTDERRDLRRMSCKTPVRVYCTPGKVEDSYFAEASNLSSSGVFIESDLLFMRGEWLELEYLIPGRALPVRGLAQVVRVENDPDLDFSGMAFHMPELVVS